MNETMSGPRRKSSSSRIPDCIRKDVISMMKQFAEDHNAVGTTYTGRKCYWDRLFSEYARMYFIGLEPNFMRNMPKFKKILMSKYPTQISSIVCFGSRMKIFFNF